MNDHSLKRSIIKGPLKSVLVLLLCIFTANKACYATADDFGERIAKATYIAKAMDYSNLPPNKRTRDVAVRKLLAVIPTADDVLLRQKLTLMVARLYGQSYNHDTEHANYAAAREFYEKALAIDGNYSFDMISARMELADLIGLEKNRENLFALYKEIITVDPKKIVAAELSPEQLAGISVLDFRELRGGLTQDSPIHKEIVKQRLERFAHNITEKYEIYRRVSIKNLIHHVYVDRGLEGLKKLAAEYAGDKEFLGILNRKIDTETVREWDERLLK